MHPHHQQLQQLKIILKRLQQYYGASAKFSRKLRGISEQTSNSNIRNLHNKILDGTINFTRTFHGYLEQALTIAQDILYIYEPQNIHITDKADWIYLDYNQIRKFMLHEIRLSLERLPSIQAQEEKRHTTQLLMRFHNDQQLIKKIQPQLTASLDFNIQANRYTLINPPAIRYHKTWDKCIIAFPSGHTATAALVFYLNQVFQLRWTIKYDITHSVYLQKAVTKDDIYPHFLILADSLAIDLLKKPKKRLYHVLGYLWQNEITVLGNKTTLERRSAFQSLLGDVYYNLSYPNSGAHLLFRHYQQQKHINSTIQPAHSSYEKALDVLQSDPQNFVITNDTQARLYEGLSGIQRVAGLSYFTDNLILFNNDYFLQFKSKKTLVLQELKQLINHTLFRLQWADQAFLEKLIHLMMNDQQFMEHYLISKSIKLVPGTNQ